MGRGEAEYILSDKASAELCRLSPKHPRIKRSLAAKSALSEILRRLTPRPDVAYLTATKPPSFMKELVIRYNTTFLPCEDKFKLQRRRLWRIFFRRQYGYSHCFRPNIISSSHQVIYIQVRHNQVDEPVAGVQKRKQASSISPIGSDYSKIASVTTIDQTDSHRLLYLCKNLHACCHGSIDKSDMTTKNIVYDYVGIAHKTLSGAAAGTRGISKDGDVVVAFPTAAYFRNLDRKLQSRGFMGGLLTFEKNLSQHILACGVNDRICMDGKIDDNLVSVSRRIWFGFGRIQRDEYQQNWLLKGTTMPGMNVTAFIQTPAHIQKQLMHLFEASTKFTCTWHKDSFSNPKRNKECAGYLNCKLGFPQSTSLFEFIDMVISRNTILLKHVDTKNCHRPGYNICCVYSYYTQLLGDEYKVSIIMTTRTTIGCAFEKAMNN